MTYYDRWLGLWDEAEAEREAARRSIHQSELDWIETRQDAKSALMIAPETGFRTWGSTTMTAEIPVGWKTGAHKHGEEVMHIVEGEGYSVVDDLTYPWRAGSTLAIPFGAPHQHVNTGDVPVRYVSTLSVELEHLAGIHRTIQLEDCGPTTRGAWRETEVSPNGFNSSGRRIVIHFDEAPGQVKPEKATPPPPIDEHDPMVLGTVEGMFKLQASHHAEIWDLMRINSDMNGFQVHEQEMSSILEDPAQSYGGKHAHMEAHLYVLSGSGHTVMDDVKVEWFPGSAVHIVGPQTVHQHVNEGDEPSRMLRICAGVRYFLEKAAKDEFPYLLFGYAKGAAAG